MLLYSRLCTLLVPVQPSSQKQVALRQTPCPLQPLGHARRLQSLPVQPTRQWQVRSIQVPAPEHSFGQVGTEQSRPRHVGRQWQSPSRQWPWCEQSSGHVRTEQSVPVNPSAGEEMEGGLPYLGGEPFPTCGKRDSGLPHLGEEPFATCTIARAVHAVAIQGALVRASPQRAAAPRPSDFASALLLGRTAPMP